MGVVYRAVHSRTGEEVALKTVMVAHNALVESLRREIYALRNIQHPGIVRVVDAGVTEGLPWYAMELLRGQTLRAILDADLHDDRIADALTEMKPGAGSGRGDAGPAENIQNQALPIESLLEDDDLNALSEHTPTTDPERTAWTARRAASPARRTLEWGKVDNTQVQAARPPRREEFPRTQPEGEYTAPGVGGFRPRPRRLVPLTPHQRLRWMSLIRRLCAPLAYLHGEGIVHRDLKPENILVKADGTPVILDFGLIAHFRGEGNREAMALDGLNAGSANYMAPEQISESTIDARADLYSLGCILYELLTGVPPFAQESAISITYGHIFRAPAPPSELVAGIPPELDQLVLRLLAKKPAERLGYAEDVARALAPLITRAARDARAEQEADTDSIGAELQLSLPSSLEGPTPNPYLYRANFVGRQQPLEALKDAIKRLQDREGGTYFIGGESGIGKTRLVTEAGRIATRDEIEVLSGRCLHTGGQPLEGFRRILIHIGDRCREKGEAETERLLGRRGSLLALYEPSLASLPGLAQYPEPAELPEAAAKSRLCSWLLETLRALSADRFVMLVLDDLQWADPLTLDFLEFLITRQALKHSGLLLVGTYRTEECPPRTRAVLEHPGAKHIELERLNEQEVSALVSDILAQPALPPLFAAYLSRQSEGNPFFVNEYLHAALDFGLLWRDRDGRWQVMPAGSDVPSIPQYERLPLPGSLRALVGRRLEGLPGWVLPVVQACAVMGRTLTLQLLAKTVEMEDALLFRALQELIRRDVLEEATAGRLRFSHDKIREVAYSQIPPAERRRLHARVAERIEALYPEARVRSAALLGYHWERGGDLKRALACYYAGGQDAIKRYAYDDAERLMRHYLRLQETPTLERIALRNQLGNELLRLQGRTQDAYHEHEAALEDARVIQDLAGQALSLCYMGYLRRTEGLIERAAELIEQGLDLVRQEALPFEQGLLYNTLALLCFDRGNLEEAQRIFELAIPLIEATQLPRYQGVVLANYASLLHSQDRLDEAWHYYERACVALRAAEARGQEAGLMTNLGIFHLEQGRIEEALRTLEEALTIHQETGDRTSQGSTLCVLAMLYRQAMGNLERAEKLASDSLTLLKDAGAVTMQIYSICELGHLEVARGTYPERELKQLRELLAQFQMGSNSEYARRVWDLEQTATDLEAGLPLFRGNRLDTLPEGLRKRLEAQGDLPPA